MKSQKMQINEKTPNEHSIKLPCYPPKPAYSIQYLAKPQGCFHRNRKKTHPKIVVENLQGQTTFKLMEVKNVRFFICPDLKLVTKLL